MVWLYGKEAVSKVAKVHGDSDRLTVIRVWCYFWKYNIPIDLCLTSLSLQLNENLSVPVCDIVYLNMYKCMCTYVPFLIVASYVLEWCAEFLMHCEKFGQNGFYFYTILADFFQFLSALSLHLGLSIVFCPVMYFNSTSKNSKSSILSSNGQDSSMTCPWPRGRYSPWPWSWPCARRSSKHIRTLQTKADNGSFCICSIVFYVELH